jgi:hypothetical protein
MPFPPEQRLFIVEHYFRTAYQVHFPAAEPNKSAIFLFENQRRHPSQSFYKCKFVETG